MPFRLLFCLLVLAAAPAGAGEGLFSVGLRTQGFVDFEPGNDYMNGVDLGYSDYRLAAHKLEFKLAYLTSRPEAAFRNVLRMDWFLISPIWHFRRKNLFDPTVQFDFGYHRYDTEGFEGLDNSTWTWGAKAGLALNFSGGRYSLRYAFGYQQATSESSLIYPLPFSLDFSVLFL
jgi:hypothetical protein